MLVVGFAATAAAQDTPEPPTILNATPGNEQVTLAWTPSTTGGVSRYRYRQKAGTEEYDEWVTIPDSGAGGDNETSYTVTGLTNDTQYTFQVRAEVYVAATDSYLSSSSNPEQSATPAPVQPDAPTNLNATRGNEQVTLAWTPSTTGGVSRYQYRQKAGTEEYDEWVTIPDSGAGGDNETSYTVTGLTNDTQYTFQVRAEVYVAATDSYLSSSSNPEQSATPAAVPPGAPTIVSVEPTSHGALTVSWNAPADLGTGTIEGYRYRVKKSGGGYGPWRNAGDAEARSYEASLLIGFDAATTYVFQLRATSSVGDGAESDEAEGTTWDLITVRVEHFVSWVPEADGSFTMLISAWTPPGTEAPDTKFLHLPDMVDPEMEMEAPPELKIPVTLSTRSGTASGPGDFAVLSETLAFAPGDFREAVPGSGIFVAAKTQLVEIRNDELHEDDETFEVALERSAGTQRFVKIIDPNSADVLQDSTVRRVTIVDDDTASTGVTLSVEPTRVAEGAGAAELRVTARLNGGQFTAATEVALRVRAGTAESADFSATTAILTIPAEASEGTATLTLTPVDDAVGEPNETVRVVGSAGELTVQPATVTILDDDIPPGAPTGLTANGGRGAVALTWNAPEDGGAATLGYDYRFRTGGGYGGWLRIPDSGVGGGNEMSYTVTDLFGLTAYTFEVRAVNAAPGPASAPATATTLTACSGGPSGQPAAEGALRLADGADCRGRLEVYHDGRWGTVCDDRMDSPGNDAPALACRAMGYQGGQMVPRGTLGMSFPAAPGDRPIWLDDVFCPVGGTNRRTGEPLETIGDCRHAGWGEQNCSRDEDVWLECTGAYADPGGARPPPAVPSLSVAGAEAREGEDETLDFTVTLAPESGATVKVNYATAITADDTATEGVDYEERTGTLTFAPGQTSQTVSVPIVDDTDEDDGETFTLTLSDAVGATIAVATATGTIRNTETESVPNSDTAAEPPPLTAEFVDMPAEHNGTKFTFQVQFSEDPAVSYKVLRDESFAVTGGAVRKARRVDGRNDLREIHVEPSGYGDVTLTLAGRRACGTAGAICTKSKKMLWNTPTATVLGPPALSVADARIEEADGAMLEFAVTLSRKASGEVTVAYQTKEGSAKEGVDYVEKTGTLRFAAGEEKKTVRVEVLDDDLDEAAETMTLTLSDPSGARIADGVATGTIVNSDAMPQAWLARFGRTVTGQVVDAVEARLRAPRAAGAEAALAGRALPSWRPGEPEPDTGAGARQASLAETDRREAALAMRRWMAFAAPGDPGSGSGAGSRSGSGAGPGSGSGAGLESRTLTQRDLLTGTSFALTARAGGPGGGFASVWGRGAVSAFDGREGDLALDGQVTTGFLGADWASAPGSGSGAGRWTAGLALGHSTGTGGYRRGDCATASCGGTVEATLTGLYPYGGVRLSERFSVWAAAGHGGGEVTVRPEGSAALTADLRMSMGAAGMRGEVVRPRDGNGLALAVKGDTRFTRTSSDSVNSADGNLAAAEADVWLVRAGVEGARPFALGDATVTPSFEVGARLDGGDAETGLGADLGGGLAFADPKNGLTFDLKARGLAVHEAAGFREWGASMSFAWDPRPKTDRGLSLSLARSWGAAPSGGMDALLNRETLAGLAANDDGSGSGGFDAAGRIEGEIGYGLPLFGGVFTGTPNLGFALADGGAREYRIGWRLTSAVPGDPGFEIGLDATREEPANGNAPAEHGVMLRGAIRW